MNLTNDSPTALPTADAPLTRVNGGSLDGKTFTITDNAGVSTTFEFDVDGTVTQGNTAVKINAGDTADLVAMAAINAINNLANGVVKAALGDNTASQARVSLIQDSQTLVPFGNGLLYTEGRYGRAVPGSNTILIGFEETWDDPVFQSILTAAPLSYPAFFGDRVAGVVNTNLPGVVTASAAGRTVGNDRITFLGAAYHVFDTMVDPNDPAAAPVLDAAARRGQRQRRPVERSRIARRIIQLSDHHLRCGRHRPGDCRQDFRVH